MKSRAPSFLESKTIGKNLELIKLRAYRKTSPMSRFESAVDKKE